MTDDAALYRLMAWLSPSYPVGAFSYSSGLEWAVEAGDIRDADSLRRWLAVVIAARFPVDEVAVADVEQPLVVRLDRRIRLGHRPMMTAPSGPSVSISRT